MANAYNFIMELPNQFKTEVGERGTAAFWRSKTENSNS